LEILFYFLTPAIPVYSGQVGEKSIFVFLGQCHW